MCTTPACIMYFDHLDHATCTIMCEQKCTHMHRNHSRVQAESTTSTSPLDISNMQNAGPNTNEGVSSVVLGVITGVVAVAILAAVVVGLLFFIRRLRQRNVKRFVKIIDFASTKRRVYAER